MRLTSLFLLSVVGLSGLVSNVVAVENWPGWRGPRGDGTTEGDARIPTHWKVPEDIVWKTPLPGKGHASPIIWGDCIFIVAALEQTNARVLICIDRNSGENVWQQTVMGSPPEQIHGLNSLASSTPTTDGERVYVSFLDGEKMFIAADDSFGQQVGDQL
jgi:outer membrane protein assembly factor BamB